MTQKQLQAIAKKHGLRVIEDCAQAHGAKLNGQTAGTFGDLALQRVERPQAAPDGQPDEQRDEDDRSQFLGGGFEQQPARQRFARDRRLADQDEDRTAQVRVVDRTQQGDDAQRLAAIAEVEPRLVEVARVLGLGFFQRAAKILIPAALPRIFVGFRLGAGIALIVAVTVEIAANPIGLGYAIMMAQQALKPALMLAILLWIGILGFALNKALILTQQRFYGYADLTGAPT